MPQYNHKRLRDRHIGYLLIGTVVIIVMTILQLTGCLPEYKEKPKQQQHNER